MWLFFSIVFLSMAVEHSVTPICPKGAVLSLFHHILTTFMLLSPFMFKEYRLNIIVTLLLALGWIHSNGKCIATQKYNEICEKGEDAKFMNIKEFLTRETGLYWDHLIDIPLITFSVYKCLIT